MKQNSSHCSRPLSSSQTTTRPNGNDQRPTGRRHPAGDIRKTARDHKSRVAVREPKSIPIPLPGPPKRNPKAHDLFHTSTPTRNREPFPTHGPHDGRQTGVLKKKLRRKEVIQPHLPVRLPCYDLVPITSLTLDGSIPQGVRPPASGATHFHDLTGGVYKARERIHRGVADPRLLATPPSWSRVADSNPN